MAKNKRVVSVRMTDELSARLDAVAPRVSEAFGLEGRSGVLLHCLAVGLAAVEGGREIDGPHYRGYAALWTGTTEQSSGWAASDSIMSLLQMVEALKLPNPAAYVEVKVLPTEVKVQDVFGAPPTSKPVDGVK